MDLVKVSEPICTVSCSNSYRVNTEGIQQYTKFRTTYNQRPKEHDNLSLHQYWHLLNNKDVDIQSRKAKIPHYVGIYTKSSYPPDDKYAKAMLQLYRPCREDVKKTTKKEEKEYDWKQDFENFVESDECPDRVKIPYERAKLQRIQKRINKGPLSKDGIHNPEGLTDKEIDMMNFASLPTELTDLDKLFEQYPKGVNYDWSKKHIEVNIIVSYSFLVLLSYFFLFLHFFLA